MAQDVERDWPTRDDFHPTDPPAAAPAVSWLRAAGSFRGHRFTLWIATGPDATKNDRDLALKSAASLAVSACWRDSFDDCPD